MLTSQQVERIARLARIELQPEDLEKMRRELSAILDYMDVLHDLDTSEIPPTAQLLPLENVTRADEISPSLSTEQALRNAPRAEDDLFRVPPVLE